MSADLGRRLSRFMVARSLGARKEKLAREFHLTLGEVDQLLEQHGDPPRVLGDRLSREPTAGIFIERSIPAGDR